MKLPKPLGLTALTAGPLLTASTALAQTITFDEIDTTNDDRLSSNELVAAFGSNDLLRFDMNGDGLSRDELRAAIDDHDDDDEYELDGNGNVDTDGNNGHGNSGGYDPSNPGESHEDRDDDEDDKDRGGRGRNNRGGNN